MDKNEIREKKYIIYKEEFKRIIIPLLIAFVIVISTSKLFINLIIKIPGVNLNWTDYIKIISITFILTISLVWLVILKCVKEFVDDFIQKHEKNHSN